ncbi:hypothetical protein SAMN04489715_0579 [Schaalia meyeri]|nr:hypothetical protein SAMN04489715_0579 [Schaalia meyeri]
MSLDLENVSAGKSALAVSAAGAGDLTLTLTWKVEQTNRWRSSPSLPPACLP